MLLHNTHHHGHTEQCRVLCRQEAAWKMSNRWQVTTVGGCSGRNAPGRWPKSWDENRSMNWKKGVGGPQGTSLGTSLGSPPLLCALDSQLVGYELWDCRDLGREGQWHVCGCEATVTVLVGKITVTLKEIATNILICRLGSSCHSSGSGCYML